VAYTGSETPNTTNPAVINVRVSASTAASRLMGSVIGE
jgi:hypothetical protein